MALSRHCIFFRDTIMLVLASIFVSSKLLVSFRFVLYSPDREESSISFIFLFFRILLVNFLVFFLRWFSSSPYLVFATFRPRTSQLLIAILEIDPEQALGLAKVIPSLVKLMRNLLSTGFSSEYDVAGVTDPFLQVQ